MEKTRYEQIKKANEEIHYMKIKRKDKNSGKVTSKNYAEVHERLKAYRKVYPEGIIKTELVTLESGMCVFRCEVYNEEAELLSTATASEKLTGNDKKDYINLTSMIENCETSAVGRALGFAGFGIDTAIASADDIRQITDNENAPMTKGQMEIIASLDPEYQEQLRNFYKKDIMTLTQKEAEVSIKSLEKRGLIKNKKEEELEKKENEEVF